MKLESAWILKLTAIALVVAVLLALDLILTGGQVLAYGRHGGSY